MNPTIKFTQTLIIVAICTTLASTGFAKKKRNEGDRGNGNTSEGLAALTSLTTGTNNTAMGTQSLFTLTTASNNTAYGFSALFHTNNDGNTAIGSNALLNDTSGSQNTAVGTGAGPNVITGFNNTYIGVTTGTLAPDESNTIRIGDLSNGNGAGSLACFIGGIFNNFQPRGGSVVVVTLDLATDELGWDTVTSPVQDGVPPALPFRAPPPRTAPVAPAQNGNVGKVEKLEAIVAQQQKQIDTLTAQLKEQAAQIQKVSAQIAVNKPAPQVVANKP